jgi:hypothetical protein
MEPLVLIHLLMTKVPEVAVAEVAVELHRDMS